jgi:hypothetical protein
MCARELVVSVEFAQASAAGSGIPSARSIVFPSGLSLLKKSERAFLEIMRFTHGDSCNLILAPNLVKWTPHRGVQ